MSAFTPTATPPPRPTTADRRHAGDRLLIAFVGFGLATLLFLALALLQPKPLPEDDARLQAAFTRVRSVELPPPTTPPPPKPTAPEPPPPRRAPLPAPRAMLRPTAPRPAPLHIKPPLPPIDPLLQNLALSPLGLETGGVTLAVDASASALAGGVNGSWLGEVDTRALAGLSRLNGRVRLPVPHSEANRKPQWLNRLDPEYPPEALRRNQEGTVSLRLRVDVAGKVVDAEVLDALAGYGFAQAAVAAARQSTFIPGTGADGQPVEQWVKVSYVFQLR